MSPDFAGLSGAGRSALTHGRASGACPVRASFPRLETLYRYAGRFGSPHHIGCADAAVERNNKVRLPSQHLLVSDRSCRAPVGLGQARRSVLSTAAGRLFFKPE